MKGFGNSTIIIPISLCFIFLIFIYHFEDVLAAPPTTRHFLCSPEQRDALLAFKNELKIGQLQQNCMHDSFKSHPRTESWGNNSDCCSWKGIKCNAKSGDVIELDLHCSFLHGRFHSNSSLQNLPFLTTLDLSFNDFYGQVPSLIGNFPHLTTLNLSTNQLSGQIPSSIGNLSHLITLQLSGNNLVGEIPYSIGNLSQLTILSLSGNNLVGEIPYSIGNLSQLTILSLWENNLVGEIPSSFGNLNKLTNFFASKNDFSGTIPSSLFTIPSLTKINLRHNQLNGTLEFGNTSSPCNLQYFSLGSNNFKGPIPRSISKLVNLLYLDLFHFDTQGRPLDFSIFSPLKSLERLYLSYLNTTTTMDLYDILSYSKSLSNLDLSGNHVSTTNKSSVSNPPSQEIYSLNLSGCGITEFPAELLRTQHEMTFLDISNNKIEGQVPAWLWTLPKLEYVNLSNNTFIGFQTSNKKQGLSSVRKPSMVHLLGANNIFTGNIPSFICELHSLNILDLSENNFNGSIPPCLGNLKSTLSDLNLRQNNLSGGLPKDIFERLRSFDVGHNQLVGKLPRSFIRFSTLEVLNVESNRINDTFPFWLGSLQKLQVLVLRSNAFYGPIHQASFPQLRIIDISHNHFDGTLPSDYFSKWTAMSSLGTDEDQSNNLSGGLPKDIFERLRSFDVGHNQLVGKLPRSFIRFSTLEVLNVESNRINDTFPFWLGSLQKLQVLVLRSNAFYGPIHQVSFPQLRIIDISHNHFDGTLPSDYFSKWTAMSSLGTDDDQSFEKYMGDEFRYYYDSMLLMNKGVEMELVRILKILTAIDFSGNKFEGEIPKSIGLMKELCVLNLSNNAFTGRIPSSMGNLTALESLDVTQNKLSGEIPQELGNLSFLAYMNFAHNQLSGLVPGGTQFRTQRCSSFEDNMGLVGSSLNEICKDAHTPATQVYETSESEEEDEEVISWIAAAIGFIPGISFGFTIGYILLSYKPKWFTNPFGPNNRRRRSTPTH
ncbi:PREDICTED: receptor-like protein 12 [Camelina sativa]|uniref:Receptor-like protein 12 n=1 Tax=Camelina sativa TaxID=90675 RepID=A0ABM0XJ49_CAMSA|nr:PREDICTED: receptor-like protein 12 [Camelina sativa]